MDRREVSRLMRISDREQAKTAAKVKRYQAECKTIDRIVDGARDG